MYNTVINYLKNKWNIKYKNFWIILNNKKKNRSANLAVTE